jgi:Xaa-Pro aminopeptidase
MLASNHYFPPFSEQEFLRRFSVLRAAMAEQELDCLVIYGTTPLGGNDTGQINTQYLTNFASVGHSYVVFPQKEGPTYHLCLPLHVRNAQEIGMIQDIRPGTHLDVTVAQRLKELGLDQGRIGVVGPSVSFFMPVTLPYEHYMHLLKELPRAEFVNVSEWYENIRSIKSPEEIALLERAAELNDLCHYQILHATRPGVSHADARRVVEQVAFMHKGNHCMMHLDSWPMDNQTWPYPDFWPTDRTFEKGHLVMTEMPVGYGMYYTKIMGTYFIGPPTRECQARFELAAAAHESLVKNLKPGMKGSDVNRFAEPIAKAGYLTAGMVSGWSNYNGPPFVGQTNPDFPEPMKQSHLDMVFKPGLCVQVMAYPISPDLSAGLWVGSTCLFTEDGLRELNQYPVRRLTVV